LTEIFIPPRDGGSAIFVLTGIAVLGIVWFESGGKKGDKLRVIEIASWLVSREE